ncbi:MAG: imidazole glycerol phosphate synthase subunit HisH [Oscillospiraceae bacterium]
MTAIVDYGVGNLFSLCSSLKMLGLEACVSGDEAVLRAAQRVILPGVGAFEDAMAKLEKAGLAGVLKALADEGMPLLGICLGMQLLFDVSYEFGEHRGLGLIKGEICPLDADLKAQGFAYKVPHMGWNTLSISKKESPIVKYTSESEYVYYVHSYYAKNCEESIVAASEYGVRVPGVVQCGNVYGTQFHPEKSGQTGLRMLKAFSEVERC